MAMAAIVSTKKTIWAMSDMRRQAFARSSSGVGHMLVLKSGMDHKESGNSHDRGEEQIDGGDHRLADEIDDHDVDSDERVDGGVEHEELAAAAEAEEKHSAGEDQREKQPEESSGARGGEDQGAPEGDVNCKVLEERREVGPSIEYAPQNEDARTDERAHRQLDFGAKDVPLLHSQPRRKRGDG